MRRAAPALLATCVLTLSAACSSAAPSTAPAATPGAPQQGFATPDDAARAYLAAVASASTDAILATSAVDEAASKFDFAAQADHLQVIQPVGNPGPAQYLFYANINRVYFANRLLSQAQTLAYSLLSKTDITGNPVPATGPQASAFAQQVDPAGLGAIQVIEVKFPNGTAQNDPSYLANSAAVAKIYGATDSTDRVALISLNGTDYEIGFQLLKYADGWKVLSQSSSLAGLPATGDPLPITRDQFGQ